MPHIAPAKKNNIIEKSNLVNIHPSIIILGAHPVYRMKSLGPPSLFDISNKRLLQHQIGVIDKVFPGADIVLVAGFEVDKIIKYKPHNVRIVENTDFENTNEIEQIRLALNNIITDSSIIINGNIFFDERTLRKIDIKNSCILLHDGVDKQDIGVILNNNEVSNLAHGLKPKWCHISYFKNKELELLRSLCSNRCYKNMFLFEIINILLNKYSLISCLTDGKFINIETYDDLGGIKCEY